MNDRILPHLYMPDYQAMGDCRVCGHGLDKPWHVAPWERLNKAPEPKEPK